jgi:hypothetical protein
MFLSSRAFCEGGKKPPKGFEKFYKKKGSEETKKTENKQTQDQEPAPSEPEPPKSTTSFTDGSDKGGFKWNFDFKNFNFNNGKNPMYWWLIPSVLVGGAGYTIYNKMNEPEVPEITFQNLVRNYLEGEKIKQLNILV